MNNYDIVVYAVRKGLITKYNALKLFNLVQNNGVLTCNICKIPFGKWNKNKTIDHIIPKSKGGSNKLYNLQLAHKSCNLRKGDKVYGVSSY